MDGYRFFRKDNPGGPHGELPFKVKQVGIFCLRMADEPVESIWFRGDQHYGRCLLQAFRYGRCR